MQSIYLEQTLIASQFPHVDKTIVDSFVRRIKTNPLLTKDRDPIDHFCSFFVPIHRKSRSIYLGHHIKAQDWIPPGGHIRFGESPKQTLLREYAEELSVRITNEPIELFDLSVTNVKHHPQQRCHIHYDFWHLVYTEKIDFKFDKGEFYDAGWFTFDEAIRKTQFPNYNSIIKKIDRYLFS